MYRAVVCGQLYVCSTANQCVVRRVPTDSADGCQYSCMSTHPTLKHQPLKASYSVECLCVYTHTHAQPLTVSFAMLCVSDCHIPCVACGSVDCVGVLFMLC